MEKLARKDISEKNLVEENIKIDAKLVIDKPKISINDLNSNLIYELKIISIEKANEIRLSMNKSPLSNGEVYE